MLFKLNKLIRVFGSPFVAVFRTVVRLFLTLLELAGRDLGIVSQTSKAI
jgi:hypothetical protein